mmetsp:Transcript_97062/g.167386  ORF Transcript_97062/g.167386 Transcript_97062/m.167386 type:complete len:110 (-) Transcript_97062:17-346(-)
MGTPEQPQMDRTTKLTTCVQAVERLVKAPVTWRSESGAFRIPLQQGVDLSSSSWRLHFQRLQMVKPPEQPQIGGHSWSLLCAVSSCVSFLTVQVAGVVNYGNGKSGNKR